MNGLFKTIFWVVTGIHWHHIHKGCAFKETWTVNMKSLPEWHWETASSRPSFVWNYHIDSLKLCLTGDLNNECAGYIVHYFICVSNHVLLTLWHKYGCHIANVCHTAITLGGNIDPTYLPKSTKLQPSATATSQINTKHVSEINLPLRCQIHVTYANYSICRYGTVISVNIPHLNSP